MATAQEFAEKTLQIQDGLATGFLDLYRGEHDSALAHVDRAFEKTNISGGEFSIAAIPCGARDQRG